MIIIMVVVATYELSKELQLTSLNYYQVLTRNSATIPEHGVVLEQFGVAGGSAPSLHELSDEERNATGSRDHQCLPDKVKRHEKTTI